MASTNALHIIHDDGNLVSANEISDFLTSHIAEDQSVSDIGLKYHVVGIFGGQSTGKSTLLNRVFSTNFQTMNSDGGQQQTTKGAFMNKTRHGNNLFIVDFEGTDGVERGEDQSFERQLSLFALSITDTLIVNMWGKDIGRYNAANMALLRTVFEVNLQLFSRNKEDPKPTLLFVIRDYTNKSKLKADTGVLTTSLEKVWESISKPAGVESLTLQDVFQLDFFPMSHYELQEEQFSDDAKLLQRRFVDTHDDDFVFNSDDNIHRIPLEGLPQYLRSCWDAIKESKDLDIPSQRELLARCRCGELYDEALAAFTKECDSMKSGIKEGHLYPELSTKLQTTVDEYLKHLQDAGKLYSARTVSEFVERLEAQLIQIGETVLDQQCNALAGALIKGFEGEIHGIVDKAVDVIAKDKALLKASAGTGGNVNLAASGTFELTTTENYVSRFWDSIRAGCEDVATHIEGASKTGGAAFGKFAKVAAGDESSRQRAIDLAKGRIIPQVHKKLESMSHDISTVMTSQFSYALSHHSDGTLRFFATTTSLRAAFAPARQIGLLILAAVFYFRLSEDGADENEDEERFHLTLADMDEGGKPEYPVLDANEEDEEGTTQVDPARILLSASGVARAYELYNQQCNFTLQMQERSLELSKNRIPTAMYVALGVLGFNEAYWLLTNPILLIFLVVIGWFFFKNWVVVQWQRFEETGPAQVVLPIKAGLAMIQPYVDRIESMSAGGSEETSSSAMKRTSSMKKEASKPSSKAGSKTTTPRRHVDPTAPAAEEAAVEGEQPKTENGLRQRRPANKEL